MSTRWDVLATNEVYHVFNRSVAASEILTQRRYLNRILDLIGYYRLEQGLRYSKFISLNQEQKESYLQQMEDFPLLVELYVFALMPDHYHLLLRQVKDKGIAKFISNVQNGFAKFFNLKHNRHGALFQNPFKAKRVRTDEELLHISRYIHLNPVTSYLIDFDKLADYEWTSFTWYLNEEKNKWVNTSRLVALAGSRDNYRQFVMDQVDYQRQLHRIKRLLLE